MVKISQNIKLIYKELKYKNHLNTALEKVDLKKTKNKINLKFLFQNLKKIKFQLSVSLLNNEEILSYIKKTEKNLKKKIIQIEINIRNLKYFVGNVYFKLKDMTDKTKNTINERVTLLFIYKNDQKKNNQFTFYNNLVQKK